jgi:hypothetical protein
MLPMAAPLRYKPMPSGIVPHEHKGRMLPMVTDFNRAMGDFYLHVSAAHPEGYNT